MPILTIAGVTALAFSVMTASAQDSSTATNALGAADTALANRTSPVQLPNGAPDVLRLTRAGVTDDAIVAFVGNSGNLYNLSPSEITYLRNQGVSDRVITAMVGQRRMETAPAVQTAPLDQSLFGTAPPAYPDDNTGENTPIDAQPPSSPVEAYILSPTETVYIIHSSPGYVSDDYCPDNGAYLGIPVISGGFAGYSYGYGGGFHGGRSYVGGGNFLRGNGYHWSGGGSHRGDGSPHGGGGAPRGGGGNPHRGGGGSRGGASHGGNPGGGPHR